MKAVNFKQFGSKEKLDEQLGVGNWMYLGRANKYYGLKGSPLGNPYRAKEKGVGETIEDYRKWLWKQIVAGNQEVLSELKAASEVEYVVCWCKPAPCHTDIVIKAISWMKERS